jgi:hypothetical protein
MVAPAAKETDTAVSPVNTTSQGGLIPPVMPPDDRSSAQRELSQLPSNSYEQFIKAEVTSDTTQSNVKSLILESKNLTADQKQKLLTIVEKLPDKSDGLAHLQKLITEFPEILNEKGERGQETVIDYFTKVLDPNFELDPEVQNKRNEMLANIICETVSIAHRHQGGGNSCAATDLLRELSPAETARLSTEVISSKGTISLASGLEIPVPEGALNTLRAISGGKYEYTERTPTERALQAALMKYFVGSEHIVSRNEILPLTSAQLKESNKYVYDNLVVPNDKIRTILENNPNSALVDIQKSLSGDDAKAFNDFLERVEILSKGMTVKQIELAADHLFNGASRIYPQTDGLPTDPVKKFEALSKYLDDSVSISVRWNQPGVQHAVHSVTYIPESSIPKEALEQYRATAQRNGFNPDDVIYVANPQGELKNALEFTQGPPDRVIVDKVNNIVAIPKSQFTEAVYCIVYRDGSKVGEVDSRNPGFPDPRNPSDQLQLHIPENESIIVLGALGPVRSASEESQQETLTANEDEEINALFNTNNVSGTTRTLIQASPQQLSHPETKGYAGVDQERNRTGSQPQDPYVVDTSRNRSVSRQDSDS